MPGYGHTGVRCGYCGTLLGSPKRCPTCGGDGIPTRAAFGRDFREEWLFDKNPAFAERFR